MTRFNPPLTPAETTALQQACAEMDTERLERIDDLRTIETCSMEMSALCNQTGFVVAQTEYVTVANSCHLAAALLAGQMAERL